MATKIDAEAKRFTFQWKIKNISSCWWLKGERIQSPSFIVKKIQGTKWSLGLHRLGYTQEPDIGFYLQRDEDCNGPETVQINFQLAFIGEDGSILKERSLLKQRFLPSLNQGFRDFEEREKVFFTNRELFLPQDTLTVQCALWNANGKPVVLSDPFAETVIETKRRSFEWRIDKINSFERHRKKKFRDYCFGFGITLNLGFEELNIEMISFDECLKYIWCNILIIDSEGKKTSCGIVKYFEDDLKEKRSHVLPFHNFLTENQSRFMLNDTLSLYFEFAFSTVEHSEFRKDSNFENKKLDCMSILIDEFKTMFNEGFFSDTEIRTKTKTFPEHKNILSARSAVFSRMFSNDMKEVNCGHVDITDFEADTVHRMLLFIYTASLEDLQFESASKLYEIADKYEIVSLKSKCSSFFIKNLCPTNACDTLVLGDLHNDEDLKNAVQNYMLGQKNKQFFCTQEWKDFMNHHNKLAGDVMYKKITS